MHIDIQEVDFTVTSQSSPEHFLRTSDSSSSAFCENSLIKAAEILVCFAKHRLLVRDLKLHLILRAVSN